MVSAFFIIAGALFLGVFLLAPFTKRSMWKATVTPLASIIGSGFLVSAPLLAREFGGYAAIAIFILIILAGLLGWAIRYNIRVVEPLLEEGSNTVISSMEKLSHVVLAFAYFISVAYYLSLLGNFVLEASGRQDAFIANIIAIALLVTIGALGLSGGATRVASLERYATALNLAVICGMLVALAAHLGGLISAGSNVSPPSGKFDIGSLPVLLGLLIIVQGFETTRFTGDDFDAKLRQRAMLNAQLISGVIYIVFFILLSPLLADLSKGEGVAAIITVSAVVTALLPISLTVAAAASQFSASIADSIGEAGLVSELTEGKIDQRHAYLLIALIGVGILVSLDVNQVIALASRAFALFYGMQCFVAWQAARIRPQDKGKSIAFFSLGLLAFAVFIFGVPSGA
ncbi:hypothetical protein [Hellea balneolensis]|uniref:hypothetical protein n=1 Tax=Hellea balneolensis TaxID=287478 RepID=UPI000400082D|nr:hypothetical protein [Hellea balneolensis]